MKALVISHGHPDFGAGGGEIAAHSLFHALRGRPEVAAATFLARTGDARLPQGAVGRLREGEYLIRRDIEDWPLLRAHPDAAPPGRGLGDLLRALDPDTVILHHVAHLGLETIADIRRALPRARLVLTLHDYLAICRNGGLMVATGPSGGLCGSSSADACGRCFPGDAPGLAGRRRDRFTDAFAAVDAFAAPSAFLAERYRAWGLDPARLRVIPNGTAIPEAGVPPPAFGETLRLGFFGQARPPKGLHVALAALHHLEPRLRARLRLDIHASRLEAQEGWYRALIERLAAPLRGEGVLHWGGAYARGDLSGRMAETDAVLVPSTWWENAPLVIEEAFAHGRPVVGSRIGGIRERVRDGVDGLLFEAGDAKALAQVLRRLVEDRSLGPQLAAEVRVPATHNDAAGAYLRLAAHLANNPGPAMHRQASG